MPKLQIHHALTLLACSALLLAPGSAHAFSDPLSYADEVGVGGGGGRWFTGSIADGFGCDVCHEGGNPVDLTIRGLPIDGFIPGTAYEITLSWPFGVENAALIAEFVDEQRHGAGTLALPRPDAMKPNELCSAEQGGVPPSELHPTEDGRTLLSLVDCGAQSLRFQWTAPLSAAGAIWFDVGFVASNEDTTPSGDGVTMVRRPVAAVRNELGTREIATGCAAAGPSAGTLRRGTLVGLFGLALLCASRRRRRREVP
ncbi:MAG TPA: hypothetical protein VJR89_36325 [Polyangiales bacterium]|nr:hypothetical protein [Polyangiales bacterium]